MQTMLLNSDWRLHEEPLSWHGEELGHVLSQTEGWLSCGLPCDVRMPLIEAGVIHDPVLADYSFESEWIEKRSWWFVRRFDGGALDLRADAVELSVESIDANGEIYLNGAFLGTHKSAHYPFVKEIGPLVLPGENILCIRVTTGLEEVSDADLAELNWAVSHEENNGCPERGDRRRAFVRKPQYTVGWDWGPKAVSCGIVKGAAIRCFRKAAIRGVNLITTDIQRDAALRVTVEAEQFDRLGTKDAALSVTVEREGKICARAEAKDLLLRSGINYVDLDLTVPDAQLWWPAGYGGQPLYGVHVSLRCEGVTDEYSPFLYGIRTVKLDTERTDADRRRFALVVNGTRIFCKGGNWIPADLIYARVDKTRYAKLLDEAAAANFNMLRVWGGGFYEQDCFYEDCDRRGILLWHDFMFACAAYPDHRASFRTLVEKELAYQTRRLRNHPCMGLWCGNNENETLYGHTEGMGREKPMGFRIANELAPTAVRRHCPQIPYWNSSPYGGADPNSQNVGDVHYWDTCMMNKDMSKRIDPTEYDRLRARFVTEYGYPGPCCRATMRHYFDGRPVERKGRIWTLHTNTFEADTVAAGVEKQYPLSAKDLDLDGYILYAGMVQMLMLEYSLEAIRFRRECSGGLFWMFDDTWGEVGWTIVDYDLHRKISYYGVRRAFAPQKLILRLEDGLVRMTACNDCARELAVTAEAGYFSFDGKTRRTESVSFVVPARSRACVYERPLPQGDYRKGIFAVLPHSGGLDSARLRLNDFRKLAVETPHIEIFSVHADGSDLCVSLRSDVYAHGVHLDQEYDCSDNYFDLLPGEEKPVRIAGGAGTSPSFSAVSFQ